MKIVSLHPRNMTDMHGQKGSVEADERFQWNIVALEMTMKPIYECDVSDSLLLIRIIQVGAD